MKITGSDAIAIARIAEHDGGPNLLNKYADPIEDARQGIAIVEAERIAEIDPSLVWMDATALRAEAASAGDSEFVDMIDSAGRPEEFPIHDAFVLDTDEMEPDEFLPVSEFLVRVEGVDAVYVALRMGEEAMYVKFDPMLMQDFLGTVRIKMVAAALKDQS